MSRGLREEIASSLVVATEIVMNEELDASAVEQAMLEVGLALVWMRKLPGGSEAREHLASRLCEELKKRRGQR